VKYVNFFRKISKIVSLNRVGLSEEEQNNNSVDVLLVIICIFVTLFAILSITGVMAHSKYVLT
jgi:hypothetical protein